MKTYFTLASIFFWVSFVSLIVGVIVGFFVNNVFWYGLCLGVMSAAFSVAFYIYANHLEMKIYDKRR